MERWNFFRKIPYAPFFCPSVGLLLCLCLILGGCGTDEIVTVVAGRDSMERTAVLDYEVPEQLPSFRVSLLGFSALEEKQGLLVAEELPETFALVKTGSGEVVLEKALRIRQAQMEDGRTVTFAVADFTEVTEPGKYQLWAEQVGYSKTFSITEKRYENRLLTLSEELKAGCLDGSLSPETVLYLLQMREWTPELFEKETAVEGGTELMDTIKEWIRMTDFSKVGDENRMLYVAALAKFGYLYQGQNRTFATECVQKAAQIYRESTSLEHDGKAFRALAELYRASGESTYGQHVIQYRTVFQEEPERMENPDYLYGAMTYMSTHQVVDVTMGNLLIGLIMDRAEQMGKSLESMEVSALYGDSDAVEEEILSAIDTLLCANYVVEGYTYNATMAKLLDVLGGSNARAEVLGGLAAEPGREALLMAWMCTLEQVDFAPVMDF